MSSASATDCVVVSTLVAVDPATAFEVFTEEIDAWWKQGPRYRVDADRKSTMRFEPKIGGRLLEVYDEARGEAREIGRVLVWDPPARLVYESGQSRVPVERTEVEIRFEPADQGTRVTVEHRGWDRVPLDSPVRHGLSGPAFIGMMGLWWADLLTAHRQRSAARGQ